MITDLRLFWNSFPIFVRIIVSSEDLCVLNVYYEFMLDWGADIIRRVSLMRYLIYLRMNNRFRCYCDIYLLILHIRYLYYCIFRGSTTLRKIHSSGIAFIFLQHLQLVLQKWDKHSGNDTENGQHLIIVLESQQSKEYHWPHKTTCCTDPSIVTFHHAAALFAFVSIAARPSAFIDVLGDACLVAGERSSSGFKIGKASSAIGNSPFHIFFHSFRAKAVMWVGIRHMGTKYISAGCANRDSSNAANVAIMPKKYPTTLTR